MKLYNSLLKKIENFKPINPPNVGLYTCGPTVYLYAHIGHMRTYTGNDILARALRFNDYKVKHVMNITDVGHLVSDEDWGEDKLEKTAKKEGIHPLDVAKKYEKQFWDSTDALNIKRPDIVTYATKHIKEQIDLIKKLEEKGFTYKTEQGVYFDASKFKDYTKLSDQDLSALVVGARDDVHVDKEKKNPYDFALWLFLKGHFANHIQNWDSPWGKGFPGWHIECSAMSMKYLGETFDIHAGGVDHINVHHTNEIAQSEGATGKPFVKYWVHHEFLMVDGKKMSKSLGNLYTVQDVARKGFDPLALRYLFLTTHYRSKMNFTWESLDSAQKGLNRLKLAVNEIKSPRQTLPSAQLRAGAVGLNPPTRRVGRVNPSGFKRSFTRAINNDLDMPQALSIVWDGLRSGSIDLNTILGFDKVLGLNLKSQKPKVKIPENIKKLVEKREKLRKQEKWEEADEVRKRIEELGFRVEDREDGPEVVKM